MPSAKGIQGNLGKALDGEADSAGKSAGKSIAGAIKGAILAAGIGQTIKAAVGEGAALQQSIGGIETLFGAGGRSLEEYAAKVGKTTQEAAAEYDKLLAAQKSVFANADQAFATAGMSANEYMELATSFSAALLNGLGGDTQAAANVADMAMRDMSDNANKMGTDMERITDAYQGFAKQNYTMLDNLKLGYGGTKTEMQRLLADAQKISGIEYNIDNLSDVYNAIHVIQGELDITGTTAEEAAGTISGSAKAMKAAFKNVLGKLTLGQDIGPALEDLAGTTTTFLVGNLLPAVFNILKALPGALVTFLGTAGPQLAQEFMAFLPQMQAQLVASGPQLMAFAQQMVTKFCEGFPVALPQLIAAAGQLISFLLSALLNNFPQIIQAGVDLVSQLVFGILQSIPQLFITGWDLVLQLISGIVQNFPAGIKAGFDLVVKLIRGIGNAFPTLLEAGREVRAKIWNTIKETDWIGLGKDIIRGMIEGIGAMAGALWDAAKNIAHSVLDSIKGALQIGSPSKVMRNEVGRWIPAGVAVGIERNLSPVKRAMYKVAGLCEEQPISRLTVGLRPQGQSTAWMPARAGAGHVTNLYQTINTHDSLSESELTREAEDLLNRQKWGIP